MADIMEELDDIEMNDNYWDDYPNGMRMSSCAICECVLPHLIKRTNRRFLSSMGLHLCETCAVTRQAMFTNRWDEEGEEGDGFECEKLWDGTVLTHDISYLDRVEEELYFNVKENPADIHKDFKYNHEMCRVCNEFHHINQINPNGILCYPCWIKSKPLNQFRKAIYGGKIMVE
tara:strand:- start:60 stop:581 length:522 start_codon:yes stop_codon:yes gene_type:complete